MKKSSLKNIILFLILIIITDVTVSSFIGKNFNKIDFGDYGTINRSLISNADILVLGSSRAQHHYNSEKIGNILNLSCYNAGLGGHGLFYNYAVLSEIVKNQKPKIVILDLSPNIIVDKDAYEKLNILLPYYKNNDAFKEVIQLNPKFSKLELVSGLYVYNSTLYDILRSYFLKSKENNSGFAPLSGEIDTASFSPFYLETEKIDNNKIKYLNKIISLCKQNDIDVLGVVSPTYNKFDRKDKIINKLDSVFRNNGLQFFNYSNYQKLYQKPKYFKDQLHMNETGAAIFSEELAQKIKTIR